MAEQKSQKPMSAAERLSKAMERHQTLMTRLTRAETEVATAERQVAEAQEEAQQEIGTKDLGKVREIYVNAEEKNEQLVTEFEKELDALEAQLREVEAQLAG